MPDPSACSCGWPFPDVLKEKGKKAARLHISFFQPLRNWGLPGNVGVYATVLPAAVVCCAVCGGGWRRPRPAHGSGGCLHSRAQTLVSPGTDSKYTQVWLENKAAQADRAVDSDQSFGCHSTNPEFGSVASGQVTPTPNHPSAHFPPCPDLETCFCLF